ncbi:MAG: dUTP diphosphatase [Patescibacteria group bacterium]|nr:dUTP diphosphatase [Patescibacteria group bacterium]
MKLKIVRIDKAMPLPEYHTPGSVAFDLYVRTGASLEPGEIKLAPGNFIVEVPSGYVLLITGRSSTVKRGLHVNLGIIDQDFHGPDDELLLSFRNFSDKRVEIKRGDRLAQGLLLPVEKIEAWEEVEKIKSVSRGGFGSTGN